VGFLGADNAKERIAGFKQAITGHNIELVDTRGDDVDFARARSNVDDVLAANPEITCMVGFYSYNSPKIYEALQAAGKLGKITVVAFDEDPVTLGAVKEGSFVGTVVQQPFEWGYQGMKMMAAYIEGDKSMIPANKLIIVPTKVIDQANVDEFKADLKAKLGK
jgi:ribose transport system substrate-binding protein